MRLPVAVLLGSALLALAGPAAAQGIRGSSLTTARYAEIRPMARDTVDSALVTRTPAGRLVFEGRTVQCAGRTCTFFTPAPPQSAVLLSQDISLTAWGLGVEGLSATVLLRGRGSLGGDFDWPRYDDAFDAILAYAELGRERYRVRLGRQRNLSGLGFTSFDGVDARYDATGWLRVEGYGGRSLGRGLESPRHQALDAVEDFLPDEEAVLLGAAVEVGTNAGVSGTLRYQTEFWADGSGRLSERLAADVRMARLGPVVAEAAADYDVAFMQLGKAHLTVRYGLPVRDLTLEATARRYRPFFELWTIWGFFSPVGYAEAELQAAWRPRPWIDLSALVAFRQYDETNANTFLLAPQDDTRRLTVRTRVRPRGDVNVDAEYQLEQGFGALANSGELFASWSVADRLRLGGYATAFQQILEFRTGNAIVLGLGATLDAELTRRISLGAGATLYRQDISNRPSGADWNQTRAWTSVEYRFGDDPGANGGGR